MKFTLNGKEVLPIKSEIRIIQESEPIGSIGYKGHRILSESKTTIEITLPAGLCVSEIVFSKKGDL